ncbi:MAG: isoleucine--tRNA ligase [Candidatus Aenigmarchaeota archaeon]|nr:isoleucine--tRNA ligase [Candidatus Aenigmarchaeota archaeon]
MMDHKAIEEQVEKRWKKQEKQIKDSISYDPKKKLFSFLEGPPTANAPPALHHLEARFMKDLVCRYKYMKGFTVPRKGGWDCHGLPVEVQVEKKLGLKSKKDVVKYGVAEFNKKCREDVFSFIEDWDKFTKKMAHWIDLEDPYITMTTNYMESVWWSLKELYDKKLLYQGHKVVPYCYRCGTALSSHEVAQGYSEVNDKTITVMFKIKNQDRYLLAWTTTPWTTPANLALAVNPKLNYVVIKQDNKEYIIAESQVNNFFESPVLVDAISGKDLIGLEYEPLFDYFVGKLDKPAWKVVAGKFVSDSEGTGIVHMAPAFGEDDYETIKENDMAFVQPVDADGNFTNDITELWGKNVLESNDDIIKMLKEKGLLFKEKNHLHDYPFCWRCKTPLIYYAMDSWFVRVSEHRDKLVKLNEKVNWFPSNIKQGRFGNWIAEAKDWALSRSKFWGTPLPIWQCECGEEEAIGSIKELRERSTKKLEKDLDLHKPYVDKIKLKCKKCGKEMTRITEVIDTWYDSGSAPFAQLHYPFENKDLFEKQFPYDFIAEAVDQTRGWFYTLHVLGALLFNKTAYKNVVCMGHLLDDKGNKMSKSKGNIINPWEMFDKYGVDATRLIMCVTAPGNPKRIGHKTVEENVRPFMTILWNSYKYYDQFSNRTEEKKPKELNIEDKWILSRTNTLVNKIEENIEKHEYHICYSELQKFVIDDLSRWYIKIIRERAAANDPSLAYILKKVFTSLSKVMAPFAPYISDYIYNNVTEDETSVHLTDWPKYSEKDSHNKLEKDMQNIMNIVEASNAYRLENSIKLKYPLSKVIITCDKNIADSAKRLKETLLKMANVKDYEISKEEIEWEAKVNFKVAGKKFSKDIKTIAKLVSENDPNELKNKIDSKGQVIIDKFTLDKKDLIFKQKTLEGEKDFNGGKLYLDTKITPELKNEWFVREFMRAIQDARKKLELTVDKKITVYIPEQESIKNFKDLITQTTGCELVFSEPNGDKFEFEFENEKYYFGVEL